MRKQNWLWVAALAALAMGCNADIDHGMTTEEISELVEADESFVPPGYTGEPKVGPMGGGGPLVVRALVVKEDGQMGDETRIFYDPDKHVHPDTPPVGWSESQFGSLRMAQCSGSQAECNPCAYRVGCFVPDKYPVSWCNGGYYHKLDNPNGQEAGGGAGYPITNYLNEGVADAINLASVNAPTWFNMAALATGTLANKNVRKFHSLLNPYVHGTSACEGWTYNEQGGVYPGIDIDGGENPKFNVHYPKCTYFTGNQHNCEGSESPRANDIVFFQGSLGRAPLNSWASSAALAVTIIHTILSEANGNWIDLSWNNGYGNRQYIPYSGAAVVFDKTRIEAHANRYGFTAPQKRILYTHAACHEIGHAIGISQENPGPEASCMRSAGTNTDGLWWEYSATEINEFNEGSPLLPGTSFVRRPPAYGKER